MGKPWGATYYHENYKTIFHRLFGRKTRQNALSPVSGIVVAQGSGVYDCQDNGTDCIAILMPKDEKTPLPPRKIFGEYEHFIKYYSGNRFSAVHSLSFDSSQGDPNLDTALQAFDSMSTAVLNYTENAYCISERLFHRREGTNQDYFNDLLARDYEGVLRPWLGAAPEETMGERKTTADFTDSRYEKMEPKKPGSRGYDAKIGESLRQMGLDTPPTKNEDLELVYRALRRTLPSEELPSLELAYNILKKYINAA